jgi:hypothetical protein
MSSGHGSGPEDPQGTPTSSGASPDDQDLEWDAWRSGPGYSRPLPPEPEPGSGAKPGSHEKPAPRHPYEDRVPGQPSAPRERPDDFSAPLQRSADPPRSSYPPPEPPAEPRPYPSSRSVPETGSYQPSPRAPLSGRSHPAGGSPSEPKAYQAPSSYEEPGTYEVPKPRPYVSGGRYEPPSDTGGLDDPRAPGTGSGPRSYDEPGSYAEPIDFRPDDADSGPRDEDEQDEYSSFWNEGRGGGAHASPSGPARGPVPPPLDDTSVYRASPPKRQLGFLVAVAAVIVAAAVAAGLLLTRHSPAKHPAASGDSSASHGPSTPSTPSAPASIPPSITGASGHLGVPGAIGSLRLNSALSGKFVGTSVKNQEANSFFIPHKDVVSGFYTTDPAATSFSSSDPRLMFLVAYLAGTGNAHSALHEFMTNHTFTNQQQISAGPKGGVAACGLLPQAHASPVTHCMWADGDTYADFYAWNSSPSALAKTMIDIRPKVQLGHS